MTWTFIAVKTSALSQYNGRITAVQFSEGNSFLTGKAFWDMKLTTQLHLAASSRMKGALTQHPLHTFTVCA